MTVQGLIKVLKRGNRYTLACFDDHGFPEMRTFFLENISIKPYKQHTEPLCLILKGTFIPWYKFIRLHKHKQFIIWPHNWHIETSKLVKEIITEVPEGTMVESKRWPSFDSRYLYRIKKKAPVNPIYEQLDKIEEPEKLITYQCEVKSRKGN